MFFPVAYWGPGGLEFIVVLLVLLLMFGAKDAPRMLRKLNEVLNQIRNTADGFKREIMYGDLVEDYSVPEDDSDEHSFCNGHSVLEDDDESMIADEEKTVEPESAMNAEVPLLKDLPPAGPYSEAGEKHAG